MFFLYLFFSVDCLCDLGEVLKVMNRFYKKKEMQKLAADHGLDGKKFISQLILQGFQNHIT